MIWVWVGAGVIVALLVFTYALCRAAALADLHSMADYAARPRRATDPWEEPRVIGGIYDAVERGEFDG